MISNNSKYESQEISRSLEKRGLGALYSDVKQIKIPWVQALSLQERYGVNGLIYSDLTSHVWRTQLCRRIFGRGVQVLFIWRYLSGEYASWSLRPSTIHLQSQGTRPSPWAYEDVRISALKSYCMMLCMLLCMTLCMT